MFDTDVELFNVACTLNFMFDIPNRISNIRNSTLTTLRCVAEIRGGMKKHGCISPRLRDHKCKRIHHGTV